MMGGGGTVSRVGISTGGVESFTWDADGFARDVGSSARMQSPFTWDAGLSGRGGGMPAAVVRREAAGLVDVFSFRELRGTESPESGPTKARSSLMRSERGACGTSERMKDFQKIQIRRGEVPRLYRKGRRRVALAADDGGGFGGRVSAAVALSPEGVADGEFLAADAVASPGRLERNGDGLGASVS